MPLPRSGNLLNLLLRMFNFRNDLPSAFHIYKTYTASNLCEPETTLLISNRIVKSIHRTASKLPEISWTCARRMQVFLHSESSQVADIYLDIPFTTPHVCSLCTVRTMSLVRLCKKWAENYYYWSRHNFSFLFDSAVGSQFIENNRSKGNTSRKVVRMTREEKS